ncbi:MAG: hypothetical protein U0R80_08905 [Nocardioidaceae bacterium]
MRATLTGVAVLGVVAAVGVAVLWRSGGLPPLTQGCTAEVNGHEVGLDLEQAENAGLIAAVSVERGLPPRAASIALATAMQESKLRNLESGDRDSVGLFQQRPSQGWGTVQQILNPYYATNRFYDALVQVDGYERMDIAAAAQEVQRSAFPDAYSEHEEDARALASALTGETTGGAFSCQVRGGYGESSSKLDKAGLTRRAAVVRRDLEAVFGDLPLGGFEAGGVTDGHMSGSAHYDGRAIDVFARPVSDANKQRGWAIAAYLVAEADRLRISTVIFDGRIWRSGRHSDEGWTVYRVPAGSSGDRAVLEHRDHVHVDVAP